MISRTIAAALILWPWTEVHAITKFKCNGRVQVWPCGMEYPNGQKNKKLVATTARSVPPRSMEKLSATKEFKGSPLRAAVLYSKFRPEKKNLGLWTGEVEGNGEIKLFLQIFREQKLESTSAMGSTILHNQQSPFTFRSSMPKGNNWSYIIFALPEPVLE